MATGKKAISHYHHQKNLLKKNILTRQVLQIEGAGSVEIHFQVDTVSKGRRLR